MLKILVPVDFSPSSLNAAKYAASLGKFFSAKEIVLYHVFSEASAGSDGTPYATDTTEEIHSASHQLEMLQNELFKASGTPTSHVIESGEFTTKLKAYLESNLVDVVAIGITGGNILDQLFGYSNTLTLIKITATPILIVPPDAQFKSFHHVGLAVDLLHLEGIIPFPRLEKWLQLFKSNAAAIHVAHIHSGDLNESTSEEKNELDLLKDYLSAYSPEMHLASSKDFTGTLDALGRSLQWGMLVVFPQKHNILDVLFNGSHVKQLAYHSDIPVLTMHP